MLLIIVVITELLFALVEPRFIADYSFARLISLLQPFASLEGDMIFCSGGPRAR